MVIANIIDNNNNSTHKSSSFPWDLHFNWKTPYLGNVKKKNDDCAAGHTHRKIMYL